VADKAQFAPITGLGNEDDAQWVVDTQPRGIDRVTLTGSKPVAHDWNCDWVRSRRRTGDIPTGAESHLVNLTTALACREIDLSSGGGVPADGLV